MSNAWLSLFQICLQAEEKELLKIQKRDEKRLLFERQKRNSFSFEDKTLTLDDYKYYINDFPHIPTNVVAGFILH